MAVLTEAVMDAEVTAQVGAGDAAKRLDRAGSSVHSGRQREQENRDAYHHAASSQSDTAHHPTTT